MEQWFLSPHEANKKLPDARQNNGVILMNIEEWDEYRYVEAGIKDSIALIEDSGLKRMIEHVCHSGGKRIRPIILLLASEICSGSYSRSLNAALAVEMMH